MKNYDEMKRSTVFSPEFIEFRGTHYEIPCNIAIYIFSKNCLIININKVRKKLLLLQIVKRIFELHILNIF